MSTDERTEEREPHRPPARGGRNKGRRGSGPKLKIYLESRYRKLERGLPQTIFYCPECKGDRRRAKGCVRCEGFGKLTRDSVQELIGRVVLPAFKAKFGKFHGAGREDIDVKMLGRGRPFVYEVVGVRNAECDLAAIDARIREVYAGRIELEPFRRVDRERVPFWKEAKLDKGYRVWVETQADVSPDGVAALVGQTFTAFQRTPQRVAYRRADLERERRIDVLAVADVTPRAFSVDIRCQHGTYVKEWVSSDDGRTRGSLAETLGVAAHCAGLDVLEIYDE